MKHRVIGATEFKSHCLALLDEINEQGGTITVTKRGRPVATISQASKRPWKSPKGIWAGKAEIAGDIVNFNTADLWNALKPDSMYSETAVEIDANSKPSRRKSA